MIPRKRLQLLVYMLGILYAFGEDDRQELQVQRSIEDGPDTSSINYSELTDADKGIDFNEQDSVVEAAIALSEHTTELLPIDNNIEANYLAEDVDDNLRSQGESDENHAEELLVRVLHFSDQLNNAVSMSSREIIGEIVDNTACTYAYEPEDLLLAGEFEEVNNLTINSFGTEWISLTWDPPCENQSNASYYISICSVNKCLEINQTAAAYNATDLDPCTEYNFTISVLYGDVKSNGVGVAVTTSNNISEIGEVENLRVHNASSDSIHLIWEQPQVYQTCVRNYSVTLCTKENCTITEVLDTEFIADDLEPCIEYDFAVVAHTETVQSNASALTQRLASPKLSEPQLANAKSSNYTLYVQWQPPLIGTNCVKHYSVTINPNSTTLITSETNITVDDLLACSTYNVSITAVNEDGENGNTVTLERQISPTVTRAPFLEISEPTASMNSILFLWSIDKSNNRCPMTSLTTTCNYTIKNGQGYEPRNGEKVVTLDPSIMDNILNVNVTVTSISPYTTYTCWAFTTNSAGSSELSNFVSVTTLEDVPSPPELIVGKITDTQFVLTWTSPNYLAGNLEGFEIVVDPDALFPVPDWCVRELMPHTLHFNDTVFLYQFLNGTPFTSYMLKIRARTVAGWGNFSQRLTFRSNPGVPDMVSKLSCKIIEKENNSDSWSTVVASWCLPCSLNGEVEYFNVSIHGTRKNYDPHQFSVKDVVTADIPRNGIISVKLQELKGEYNYTLSVSVKVHGVDELGVAAKCENIIFPAGIPALPEQEYVKSISVDPYIARRSTTSAAILLPLFPDTNGDIIYYSIIISELGFNPQLHKKYDLKSNDWPNESSWEEAMLQDFAIPYQATRPRWDPYPNYVADYGHMKAVKYVLGDDTNCKEISSKTKKRVYCNGPLKQDTWYHVRMRAFTYGGYADSQVFIVKTNAELNVAVVIGIIFGILFLGILTTMMLLVRKWSPIVILRRCLHSDMSGSPVPTPFTRKKFIAHCQQLVDNPGKLSNEFRLLQTLSVDLQMPTNTACLQANRKKNRYSDILPYDFSRVKLETIDNDPNTDYINASFIRGYTVENEYIACQGPKEETTYDFWRMVDQYNVNIIVMLTQLIEKGKEKCHQYFPAIRETFRYENMTIRCTSELDFRTYTQRTLMLQKETKKRNVVHLHFKDWPDHDVPEDFDPMINFCQIMRRNIMANKGYVIIHCSAGIGRTGTLIAIDILLQHLRDNRKLDVFGTVYRLRHHRINMVQRESQYAYIYNCIKQVLKNPYCLKSYKPPPVDPVYRSTSKKGKAELSTNANPANNFETPKKRDFFMSMDSIKRHEKSIWTHKEGRQNILLNGFRPYKSTSALHRQMYMTSKEESTLWNLRGALCARSYTTEEIMMKPVLEGTLDLASIQDTKFSLLKYNSD